MGRLDDPPRLADVARRIDPAAATVALAAFGALIAAPFLVSNFAVGQLITALTYAIAILGLNLLTGVNGQFSLGHGAFFAVGAYVAAMLMHHAGAPYPLVVPAAAAVCFAAGVLFGLPALRLENVYMALATFALAVATPQILKLTPLEGWTGGSQGLSYFALKPQSPVDWLTQNQWIYFFSLGIGLSLYWFTWNLLNSRTGRALLAVRDNPIAASAMGVDVARFKTICFGLSAMIAGVAGSLKAIYLPFVAPDSFSFSLSIALFVGMVVGGVGWLPGAAFGGLFLVYAPNIAEEAATKGLSGAIYGAILIALIYLAPSGVGGVALGAWKRIRGGDDRR